MSILSTAPAPKTEILGGRYELLAVIGHGGMGTVYRALQLPIEREVAVKVLRRTAGDDPRAVRRFFKEARSIAHLHHPHVIALYDFGQADTGDLYLVMELLPGCSLADIMHRAGPIPLGRAADILDQVLDALHEAHRNSIVHRDLKPENIQVGRRGDRDDFVTVLDFGIARNTDLDGRSRPETTTIDVAGTPVYMSPEQILGSVVDPRTDLYALGVLLFEMVAGRAPFDSEKMVDIYMMHLKEPVPKLRELAPPEADVPGLQELVERAMAKAPEDRFPSAQAFRRALRAVAGFTPAGRRRASTTPGNGSCAQMANATGFELVATADPPRSPGLDDLIQQWVLDVAQHGGAVRERQGNTLIATFPTAEDAALPIRTALTMKQRTRAQRLAMQRPLYIRIGIHQVPQVASKLCEEAPRGGIVIGADCVSSELSRSLRGRLRLEPAGEVRMRGHRGPIRMLQLLAGRST